MWHRYSHSVVLEVERRKLMGFELDPNYKDVPARVADLKAKHPEARLRPLNEAEPFRVLEMPDGRVFVVYAAACHRDKDDTLPGVGMAWEPYPGRTPYTKDSELQNAETSAWGRAIVACLASESKSVASAEDVRNRAAEADAAETEAALFEAVAREGGWKESTERAAEFTRLHALTDSLPADERKLVVKDVAKAKLTAWFTREQAEWWANLIALALPAGDSSLTEKKETQ